MNYQRCDLCQHPLARHISGPFIDYDCVGDCDICNVQSQGKSRRRAYLTLKVLFLASWFYLVFRAAGFVITYW